MIEKNVKLWLGGARGITAPVHVSQYDTGWRLLCTIYRYDSNTVFVPGSTTGVILEGKKPDGTVFAVPGSFSNGLAVVDLPMASTAAVGPVEAELRITEDGVVVGTVNFVILVEAAPLKGYVASGDDFSAMQQLVDQTAGSASAAIAAADEAAASAAEAVQAANEAKVTVASPFVIAATASAMTDHTKAYVYTGETTATLEHGSWYYWSNGAWTKGGQATDTTLTMPGVAADAKATGDAIGAVEADVDDVKSAFESEVYDTELIDLSLYAAQHVSITAAGLYTDSGYSKFIPTNGATKIIVTANSNEGTVVSVLTTNSYTLNKAASFATGYTGRVGLAAGASTALDIPDNGKYILVLVTSYAGIDLTPSSIEAYRSKITDIENDMTQTNDKLDYTKDLIFGLANTVNLYTKAHASLSSSLTLNDTGKIVALESGDGPRAVSLNVKPSTTYRIKSDIPSHKAAGTFANYVVNGATAHVFEHQSDATTDDLIIKTSASDHVLFIRMFTNADGLTAEDFVGHVLVSEFTAEDNLLREAPHIVNTLSLPDLTFEIGTISNDTGGNAASIYYCRSGFVDALSLPEIYKFTGLTKYYKQKEIYVNCFVYEYAGAVANSGHFLRRAALSDGAIYRRSVDCTHVRFTCGWAQSTGVSIYPTDAYQIFELTAVSPDNLINYIISKPNWRTANTIARMRQMASIVYKAMAVMPNQSADMAANADFHGVPYSSVRALDTFVGLYVSLHTFYTATRNPRSVIYTRRSTNSNSKTYYGTVCSAFADYCFGLDYEYPVKTLAKNDAFKECDFYNIGVGDVLLNDVHGIVIADIEQDKYGQVIQYGVVQAQPPRVNYRVYTPSALKAFIRNNDYSIYKCEMMSDNDYEPCQYVAGYPDEALDFTYPDIMSEYGDKAVIIAGQDIAINVLDTTGYTTINVYKDGTLTDTKSVLTDFTIPAITYGTWKVELTDGAEKVSTSEFIAVDVSGCTYNSDTKELIFGSANATPVGIGPYGQDGGFVSITKLTSADVSRGTYDMTNIVSENDPYVRVVFKTAWGKTAWRSYDLHKWAAVT